MTYPKNSSDSVAHEQLQSFVRRIEALDDEIKVLNEDKSEVYGEAKGNGFDTKIIRKVVAARRQDAGEREMQDELFQLYWNAVHGLVHAHVEIIEEIPPHDADGVILETSSQPERANTGGSHETSAQPELVIPGRRQLPMADEHQQPQPVETHIAPVESAADEISTPIPEPETVVPPAVSEAGDESAETLSAALVVPSNVTTLRTHNPATHFVNSEGLARLHGCLKPELCGSSQPRTKLCFNCSVVHDGPSPQNGVA